MTFDEQVAALRRTAEPRAFKGRKSDATPEQWASHLNYSAAWKAANPDVGREQLRRWRAANREAAREQGRRWRSANREAARTKTSRWREAHPTAGREYMKRRRAANPEWAREADRRYQSGNASYRLRSRLRNRLRDAVRGNAKSGSAVRDLGCSIEELKSHIERQWVGCMSWENWGSGPGTWQIDHVYPLAQTDLTDRAQLLAVCNWRNLQPLWFEDNVRKGDTVTPEAQQLFDGLASEFGGA